VKRANSVLFIALIVLVGAALAACKPSPKARADEFVRYLPGEVGDWEREDKDTVKLLSSTITNMGHVIMIYEGADDAIAYITVEAHPSIDSAELALTNRERELLLDGLELDKDRQPPKAAAGRAGTGQRSPAAESDSVGRPARPRAVCPVPGRRGRRRDQRDRRR